MVKTRSESSIQFSQIKHKNCNSFSEQVVDSKKPGLQIMSEFHWRLHHIIFPRNLKPENWPISIQISDIQMEVMQRWSNGTTVSSRHRNAFNFQLKRHIRNLVDT